MKNIICFVLFIFVSVSFSQIDSSDNVKEADKVVVTALKKETELQKTSVAVTPISSEDIEDRNIRDLEDAQFSSPGVYFSQGVFTGANTVIRGIGSYTAGASFSGNVSYRMDDTNVTAAWFADGELFDINRFEILRGPQGTLFGGNNPAGTFNLISNGPSDPIQPYISIEVGDSSLLRYTAASNFDLGTFASTRIAAHYAARDGYVENLATNKSIDDLNYFGIRSTTDIYFSDRLTGSLTLFHHERDDASARTAKSACNPNEIFGCDPWGSFPEPGNVMNSSTIYFSAIDVFTNQYPGDSVLSDITNNIYANSESPSDLFQVSYDFTPQKTVDSNSGNFQLQWDLDKYDVQTTFSTYDHLYESYAKLNDLQASEGYMMGSITANIHGLGEESYSADNIIDKSYSLNNQNEFEVRFNSKFDGPFNYTSGFYYSDYQSHTIYSVSSPGLEYFGNVGKGPIGQKYPTLAGYGGQGFWLTFTGTYLTTLSAASADAANGFANLDASQQILINDYLTNVYNPLVEQGAITVEQAGSLAVRDMSYDIAAQTTLAVANATGATLDAYVALGLSPVKAALPDWQLPFTSSDRVSNTEIAAFSELSYDLNSKWKMRVGGRLNSIVKDQLSWSGASDINHLQGIDDVYATEQDYLDVIPEKSATFDHFTGRLIMDYQVSESNFMYFGYNRGLKAGGYNPATDIMTTTISVVDPELHNMFEVGNRRTFFDGKLTLNSHAYANSVDGMQLQRLSGLATETYNADAQINGLEFDFFTSLFNKIRLDGNVAYNHSKIKNFKSINSRNPYGASEVLPLDGTTDVYAASFTELISGAYPDVVAGMGGGDSAVGAAILSASAGIAPIMMIGKTDKGYVYRAFGYICNQAFNPLTGTCPDAGVEQDLSGNQLPFIPSYSLRVGAEMDMMSIFEGDVVFRTDVIRTGPSYISEFNEDRSLIPAYNLVNVDLSWKDYKGKYSFDFHVFNVFDNAVIVGGNNSTQVNGGVINFYNLRPRSFGTSLVYHF